MTKPSLIELIVKAWTLGFPVFWPESGIVDSVDKVKKTLKIKIGSDIRNDVTWIDPVTPQEGSKCLLVARNNKAERYTAFAFEKVDEVKTKIADTVEVDISKDQVFVNFNNLIKVSITATGFLLDLGGKKFTIIGDVEQTGNFKTTGKVDAKMEVTAFSETPASVALSTHLTDYVDTPVGAAVTSKPKAGT
ncbi:hypothetical protein [Leptospira borgpetersenii]|uniref:hypothetical protein n=1 Tax=Leptospira borgpetersenii TaxID=174 RepID=UPI0018807D5F|nr:hypothetical protein [Leptospira borgpetersenii]MBE8363435.1 hypothetical protein [Leptospira borgpetersenii serovar Balcanica]MBE8367123.1 hypothetical protein [Leptospira borgpetersenii serovar Balcanica]MBE8422534.1 hypothetical protein [Leptospira borgpetersenii serovar Balcanica]MBF3349643.1 hypothetical protein [Leptospira borgpetersenii serovar Balcanica]